MKQTDKSLCVDKQVLTYESSQATINSLRNSCSKNKQQKLDRAVEFMSFEKKQQLKLIVQYYNSKRKNRKQIYGVFDKIVGRKRSEIAATLRNIDVCMCKPHNAAIPDYLRSRMTEVNQEVSQTIKITPEGQIQTNDGNIKIPSIIEILVSMLNNQSNQTDRISVDSIMKHMAELNCQAIPVYEQSLAISEFILSARKPGDMIGEIIDILSPVQKAEFKWQLDNADYESSIEEDIL